MALSNAEKQRIFREKKAKAGKKKREFYLTDKNFISVKEYIKKIKE